MSVYLSGSNLEFIILIAIAAVILGLRVFMMKTGGNHAKCPKCGAVFDASHIFPSAGFGPIRHLKCPACGVASFMNSYRRDPITWPPAGKKTEQTEQAGHQLSDEELEKQRIEDSKYEKS